MEKNQLFLQVTDDPRFYPIQLNEKEKYRLKKLGAVIEGVPGNQGDPEQCLYPQGRALQNFPDAKWNAYAPKCSNIHLLLKQRNFTKFDELIDVLTAASKFCIPAVAPDGGIKLGESSLCPSVATIYDSNDEIMDKIRKSRCGQCQIALEKLKAANPLVYTMLGYDR